MFSGKVNYMLLCKHTIGRIFQLLWNECAKSKEREFEIVKIAQCMTDILVSPVEHPKISQKFSAIPTYTYSMLQECHNYFFYRNSGKLLQ